jgi:hypothetical protein
MRRCLLDYSLTFGVLTLSPVVLPTWPVIGHTVAFEAEKLASPIDTELISTVLHAPRWVKPIAPAIVPNLITGVS